jgi:signal transduction histidine kinase
MDKESGPHPLLETLTSIDRLLGLTHVFVRDRESRIVYWGAGAQKLYGWPSRLAIGRTSHELLRTVFPIPLAEIERIVAEEGSWQGQLTHSTRLGEVKRVASYWARYRDVSDPGYCILEENNDITPLFELSRQLDDALKQAREAIEMRDSFVATVAHELRTPLNAVRLAAEAARLTLASNREEAGRNLERAISGTRSMAALIERLLESTRISSGRLELDKRPVDMVEVVRSAVEMMWPLAHEKGIKLRAEMPVGSARALGDAERLEESIRNLLSNAIKFTPEGGHIDLRMARDHGAIEITVVDDGEGIDPAFMPCLFDPMTKSADAGHNRDGLGLGLFIARRVIELHGGEIIAFSEGKGRGAAFTVKLPSLAEESD